MGNPVEVWKSEKHPFDVWSDIERYAAESTPMKGVDKADLERMKWHGFFFRKRDESGRYMNRIRITAGELDARQAKEIAYIAYQRGHGIVDITTRANLQVQGLGVEHLPEVARRLERVDLTSKQTGHDNIRNVFAHPYSGLLPDEIIDTRPLCHEVTELFLDSRDYADLPRKLNICLNGTANHSAHFWTQDISFLATRNAGGGACFHVLVGGTQGQNPHLARRLPVVVAPDQVVDVTRAIIDLFRARGSREKRNAARFCFLVNEIGVDGVMQWLDEQLPFELEPCSAKPEPASAQDELVGWFRQSDPELWTMGLSVPLGRMTWRQLEGLAVLGKRWGDGQLRTTHEQGIAVINIPSGFKHAASTDAAALGLSVHADPLELNTMACTGSQFCNIAVTETKGQMFLLLEKLRKKTLMLHGIRIHMSGCPSSCAQHFTADIGLKGVRVRRLLGTREGFDVLLGGGIAGQMHMGMPYKLGVDVDQLPTLIEEVVTEYYQHHEEGQTFSAFWRERLTAQQADKVKEEDYQAPVWICEGCDYEHRGEDPPIFCPGCAGLRRQFARIEESENDVSNNEAVEESEPVREDGFAFAAAASEVSEGEGVSVEVDGRSLALFRVNGAVRAVDGECPHEGAPLAEGQLQNGKVTCPWHGWTFNACTGCSLDPQGNDVRSYETLVEDDRVFVRVGESQKPSPSKRSAPTRPREAAMHLFEIIEEGPDVRTFRFDNRENEIPHDLPGRFVSVRVPHVDGDVWRSFTISSSPTDSQWLDLTIKLNPRGVATPYLFDELQVGGTLTMKGPLGGFCFDPPRHGEPLALVSAGSGITPMMSIARYLRDSDEQRDCTFLYGARREDDILFRVETNHLASELSGFRYRVSLSQPDTAWAGECGRIDAAFALEKVPYPRDRRWFLCGPNEFMSALRDGLMAAGVPAERIHTEQFHAALAPVS